MAYSEAQKRASRKYNEENYDRLSIYLKHGSKDKLKAAAEMQGISVNKLIENSLKEYLDIIY